MASDFPVSRDDCVEGTIAFFEPGEELSFEYDETGSNTPGNTRTEHVRFSWSLGR